MRVCAGTRISNASGLRGIARQNRRLHAIEPRGSGAAAAATEGVDLCRRQPRLRQRANLQEAANGCDRGSRLLFHQPVAGVRDHELVDVVRSGAHDVRHGRPNEWSPPTASTGSRSRARPSDALLSIAS
jgi:hypothetical protein